MRFDHQQAQELADDLESQAEQVPLLYAVMLAFAGAAATALIAGEASGPKMHLLACTLGFAGGGVLGFLLGRIKATQIQIQAMLNLGQLQVERNTRKEKPVSAEVQAPPTGSSVRRDPPQLQKTVLARPTVQKAAP